MKRILIAGGILVLVLILAGAAFVGGQLLNGQALPGLGSGGVLGMMLGGPSGNQHVVRVGDIIPAKELPQGPADARGLFDHRQDNSIFVGTGQVNVSIRGDRSGKVTTSASHTGPVVEVVVSPKTVVYRDTTDEQFDSQQTSGGKVQQVVEPGSLDEAGQYSMITAWGKKTGDRIIADVLVYTLPPVLGKP